MNSSVKKNGRAKYADICQIFEALPKLGHGTGLWSQTQQQHYKRKTKNRIKMFALNHSKCRSQTVWNAVVLGNLNKECITKCIQTSTNWNTVVKNRGSKLLRYLKKNWRRHSRDTELFQLKVVLHTTESLVVTHFSIYSFFFSWLQCDQNTAGLRFV